LGIEDQRFRTLGKNYKKEWPNRNTEEGKAFFAKQRDAWQARRDFVLKYLSKNPWPGYKEVGEEGSAAAFYIVQHSNLRALRKACRKLKKAAFTNNASKRHYAMMYDRILIFPRTAPIFKQKQLYGTQVAGIGGMKDGKYITEGYELFPLKKPKEVNKLRKELGMEPLEESLKRWNIEFNIPQKE
jgi:hypothetical protein